MKILAFLTKRFFYYAVALISFTLIFGCVDPFMVEVDEGLQLLTVEGMITNGPGPHKIKLTRSDTYGSVFESLTRPVAGATVIIRDQNGAVTFLEEDTEKRGEYLTDDDFRAKIGNVYSLQIQLSNGDVYTSFPEKVNPSVEITGVSYESEVIPVEGEMGVDSGVAVYVDLQDPLEENNFYFWRNDPFTYELNTRPDLFVNRETMMPEPKECCFTCYLEEEVGNTSIFIASDDSFNGLATRLKVAFIPDDGLRFITFSRLDINQLIVTAEAYRFLRLVKQQTEISGSVFDPPPATIRGNIISLDNPDEMVLGYFIVASESNSRVYIDGTKLDFRQPRGLITDDCRVVDDAVTTPPIDWNP